MNVNLPARVRFVLTYKKRPIPAVKTLFAALFLCTIHIQLISSAMAESEQKGSDKLSTVGEFVKQRQTEFDKISKERRGELDALAVKIAKDLEDDAKSRLVFICTHNSRRSQLSQVWADTAASIYKVKGIESFSGGTEETAFNPRAVKALREAGFEIKEPSVGFKVGEKVDVNNPRYQVRHMKEGKPLVCFSKVYDQSPNPKKDFIAVMTCSEAEKSCPRVSGSSAIVSLSYEDPKVADDTPEEAARYAERCAQISREMLYLFSHVKNHQTTQAN